MNCSFVLFRTALSYSFCTSLTHVSVSFSDDFDDVSRDETNLPEAIEKFYKSVTSIDERHKLAYVLFSSMTTLFHSPF